MAQCDHHVAQIHRNAGTHQLRGQLRLVGVTAEDGGTLAGRPFNRAQPSDIGGVPDHIGTVAHHRGRGFAPLGGIAIIAGDNANGGDRRHRVLRAEDEGVLDPALGRVITTADKTDDTTLGEDRGQSTGTVGHVPVRGIDKHGVGRNLILRLKGGGKEELVRVIGGNFEEGAAILEAVADDQLVAIVCIAACCLRDIGLGNVFGKGNIEALFFQPH